MRDEVNSVMYKCTSTFRINICGQSYTVDKHSAWEKAPGDKRLYYIAAKPIPFGRDYIELRAEELEKYFRKIG